LLIFEVTWLYELFWVLLNLWPNVAWGRACRAGVSVRLWQMLGRLQLRVLLWPLYVLFFPLERRLYSAAAPRASLSVSLLSGVSISDCANFNFCLCFNWRRIFSRFLYAVLKLLILIAASPMIGGSPSFRFTVSSVRDWQFV
jgi:hypothetical protein